MALKRKIGSTEFETLNESLRGEYKKNDADGLYYLEVDDAQELVNALERVREENKGNKALVDSLTQQINAAKDELARKSGDVTAIENSWKERLKSEKEKDEQEKKQLRELASRGIADKAIDPIANKFKVPSLVKKAISDRVKVVFEENGPVAKVLDKDGKLSAMTFEDLEKEILQDKEFSSILIQSRASGSTSNTGKPSSGSAETDKKWRDLSPKEAAERLKASKETQN